MSPYLLGPEIIGEDAVILPTNNPPFEPKSHVRVEEDIPKVADKKLSQILVGEALRSHIESIDLDTCLAGGEDSFFVADIGQVYRQHVRWVSNLPRIEPFYAMKCNNDPMVLKLFSSLGLGFDCASKDEIENILDLGVDPSRIIYAHPCKAASYMRYASMVGVKMMTFDNADELYKCKRACPNAQLLLRIMTDDSKSLCQFSIKFGAHMDSVLQLLKLAQELELNVVGVSFHVGSGASDPSSFVDAVSNARRVFDLAKDLGMPPMSLLDVGGGFVDETFDATAKVLGPAVDKYFPSSFVRVIAEPGRYFVSSAFTLATNIVGRRVTSSGTDKAPQSMLYINDGVYANMNCIIFDHQEPVPKILTHKNQFLYREAEIDEVNFEGDHEVSIWGPTCDGLDVITKSSFLPLPVDVGDWLYFTEFGAYTLSASTTFNGFNTACQVRYVCSDDKVKELLGL